MIETVIIVRKDHPEGKVRINKSDMKDDDVIYTEKQEKVNAESTNKRGRPAKKK